MLFATIFMLLLFVLSVLVQYNDPDPIGWMAIYGAAAIACVLYLRRRLPVTVALAISLVAAIWAASIVTGAIGKVTWNEVFGTIAMVNEAAEIARETMGLALVAVWMSVLAFDVLRKQGPGSPSR